MRRWTQLLIALAIVIAAQPLVHTHAASSASEPHDQAISSFSAVPCAVCATANAKVTVSAPTLHVAFNVVQELTAASSRLTLSRPSTALSSRAPPAA